MPQCLTVAAYRDDIFERDVALVDYRECRIAKAFADMPVQFARRVELDVERCANGRQQFVLQFL